MNYGFRIVYHKSIPWSKELEEFLVTKINHFTGPDSYKCRRDSSAYYRRGIVGYLLNKDFIWKKGDYEYTFKRLVNGRRIFGIVPITELQSKEPLNFDKCHCAIHAGGQRATLETPYKEEDYTTFFETGLIKG